MANQKRDVSRSKMKIDPNHSQRGDVTARQLLENHADSVRFSEAWMISSMPRGGLQLIQSANAVESWLKPYSRKFHKEDAPTWRSILENRVLRGDACFSSGLETSRYYRDFMKPGGLRYLAVAPLAAPIFEGYPGALHFYRTAEQGDFTDQELKRIAEIAADLNKKEAESRASRTPASHSVRKPWIHRPKTRQLILDSKLHFSLGSKHDLDDRVLAQILSDAKHRLAHLEDENFSERTSFPDSNGDLWTFRVMPYAQYPALGRGAALFYCLEPEFTDWKTVRAADVSADPSLSRLVPAMHYMQEEFHRGPTLNQIAKVVHLSAFHFHRRFTDLWGITPKHFLLECQISTAKLQLAAGEEDLVDIAKMCGFAHQSHFTSRFKQATGLTPTRWRRLARRLENPPKE